ncbi:T-cell receptor alpha chain V region 2B4 [Camelus ferus]|nr:T-cell receptor alpha chain V region 2B4 [Camelus ferus]
MKRLVGAVLGLLFAQVCCVTGEDVEQSPPVLSLQEGATSTLWCKFSTTVSSLHWYRQNPGDRLIHLFSVASGTKHDGRFSATTVAKERRSSLNISSSQTTDSATYFCAVSTVLPGHLQPEHQPSAGSAPPQPQSHHEAATYICRAYQSSPTSVQF